MPQHERPHREAPPRVWMWLLTEFFAVPPPTSARLWQALGHATGRPAVTLRSSILYHETRPFRRETLAHVAGTSLGPEPFMMAVEGLIAEGLWTRRDAVAVEEAILRHSRE